jgi:hypothetical protein
MAGIEDLKSAVAFGRTLGETAEFLYRSETAFNVAAKAKETWPQVEDGRSAPYPEVRQRLMCFRFLNVRPVAGHRVSEGRRPTGLFLNDAAKLLY